MTWTAICTCRTCHKEVNRATRVPQNEKVRVDVSAPLMALCEHRSHNTGSDYNLNFDLVWQPGTDQGPEIPITERTEQGNAPADSVARNAPKGLGTDAYKPLMRKRSGMMSLPRLGLLPAPIF